LRDVLNDRALVLEQGQDLVKSLLVAYQGLEEKELIVRNIAPRYIRYSSDYGRAIFCDLRAASIDGKVEGLRAGIPAPYGSDKFEDCNRYGVDYCFRDHWCIGLILLEVFIGSELVLSMKTHKDFGRIFWVVYSYMDAETKKLLQHLLFGLAGSNLSTYVSKTLVEKKELVATNIRRIQAAAEENAWLQKHLKAAKEHFDTHADELFKTHKAKRV